MPISPRIRVIVDACFRPAPCTAFQRHRGRAGDARQRGVDCTSIIKAASGQSSRSGVVDGYFVDLSMAADSACDVPADALRKSSSRPHGWRSLIFLLVAQRSSPEVEAVTAVHDPVENGVGRAHAHKHVVFNRPVCANGSSEFKQG